ncbi:MAG: hypothetical protein IJN72_00130 [Firmicutes bacterium]|nr:hypothetical protein [Bacillota bacterium]MBR1990007.1 hypothetical protein [Bacillota bacterium]
MYRADGYRVRTNDAMYELVPYIMPYRYDASNTITVDIDLDLIQDYIRKCRKKGIQMSHMSIIIAGALRLVSQNPNLNRFIMNRKIYSRNHFCVSFVTLQPGKTSDTVTKLYFNLDDDIFTVNQKVQEAIERTQVPNSQNALDKLMASLVRIPFLVGTAVGILKFIDKYFTLPFSIINASPFHTSLFVTNLASIRTDTIHHHLYEFGTTGIFISMGQPKKKVILNGENVEEHKVMELGIVTDERIANGHYYGRCFRELNKYYKNPELLETRPESVVRDPDIRVKNPKFIVK